MSDILERDNKQKGFTLANLLIVMATIAILGTIAIPNFINFRQRIYDTQSQMLLRELYAAYQRAITEYGSYQQLRIAYGDKLSETSTAHLYLKKGTWNTGSEFFEMFFPGFNTNAIPNNMILDARFPPYTSAVVDEKLSIATGHCSGSLTEKGFYIGYEWTPTNETYSEETSFTPAWCDENNTDPGSGSSAGGKGGSKKT